MQRLFSTFAEGWPGAGLLLQRLMTSTILLHCAGIHILAADSLPPSFAYLIAAVAGIFLLLGLWTPVAGITIAISGMWVWFSSPAHSLVAIMVAALGATAAMIGPGIWSVDARLYGRKHLEDPRL